MLSLDNFGSRSLYPPPRSAMNHVFAPERSHVRLCQMQANELVACEQRWFWALPGRAGGAVVEATVDHTLMRGSEPHDR